ncbi:MAG: S8 family serine peptidase [Bacteroidota bacterium]
MKELLMSFCVLLFLLGAKEMSGQYPMGTHSTVIEKFSPQQFVEGRQYLQNDILGAAYILNISFKKIPTRNVRRALTDTGIELLKYQRGNTYLARVPVGTTISQLEKCEVVHLRRISIEDKISPELKDGNFPEWAVKLAGTVDVAISLVDASANARMAFIQKYHIRNTKLLMGGELLIGRIQQAIFQELVASPMVVQIDAIEPPIKSLNQENRVGQRVNILQSSLPGGRNLDGAGVVVGVGDGGELGTHIDFEDRVINYANGTYTSFGQHGDHVAGIIGGAGNLDPVHKGMAPASTIITQKTTSIIGNAQTYYNNHEMIMTNNSYGVGYNCENNGSYNFSSSNLDWQSREMPYLLHVFAAGNSGYSVCGSYPDGFKSVLRYYQSAKNVLTVGNTKEDRTLNGGSSKGPVQDGRLKPEISAFGTNVTSTGANNNYYPGTGTSMAAPSVVGTLALLNQLYRNLNNGNKPVGALMKAIACNTADDLGNVGPDYSFGYGLINARRAAECIENNRYDSESLSDGETRTFNITVPSGAAQVKVMLYWHDKEASAYPDKALINDLDLTLTTPGGATYLPWVLNHDTLHVEDLPTRKVDTLNNMEQVTLDNPTAGTYTITIKGTHIPSGPQDFFITYDFLTNDVLLTYPYGGEGFEPGSTQLLQWDTDITNTSDFTIEYSINGGNNWNTIATGVDAGARHYNWSVPNVNTENAFIRITKENASTTDENNYPFYILERPIHLEATPVCEGHLEITWDAVAGMTSYEVYTLSGSEMVVIDTTTTNTYYTESLTQGENYWYAVRGLGAQGGKTERSIAIEMTPSTGGICPWDYDLKLQDISFEAVGRAGTSISLSNSESITVGIKNLGINTIDSFDVEYEINNGTMVSETHYDQLLSGDSITKTFATTADLSTPGIYNINAYVQIPEDVNFDNNEIVGQTQAVQLANDPITLPFGENFEGINVATFGSKKIGLTGIIAWDFNPDSSGELIFVDEGTNKCVETKSFSNNSTTEGLTLTLNMTNYTISEEIYVSFDYKYTYPDMLGEGDTIYIRGSDTDDWIALEKLNPVAHWINSENDISQKLSEHGQNYSSSFQIHFSQGSNTGYALDNFLTYSLTPLPVELTSFTATRQGDDVILIWETSSELNNERFDIVVAGQPLPTDEENYKRIGTVSGAGTTTTNQSYTFLDDSPFKSGLRYYRLKQYDFDGTYHYSDYRVIDFGAIPKVKIFPNPFVHQINVGFLEANTHLQKIQLVSTTGRIVFETTNVEGAENFELQLEHNISPGMYFLRLITAEGIQTYPVLRSEQ